MSQLEHSNFFAVISLDVNESLFTENYQTIMYFIKTKTHEKYPISTFLSENLGDQLLFQLIRNGLQQKGNLVL